MHSDLVLAKRLVYNTLNFDLSNFEEEPESKEYAASTFLLNKTSIKFRVAKITPIKVGAFVTLWKRNEDGITCPHAYSDPFDFYIISIRKDDHFGQFIFPKAILIKQAILSSAGKEGKRGFRVYAPWHLIENKQAIKLKIGKLSFL